MNDAIMSQDDRNPPDRTPSDRTLDVGGGRFVVAGTNRAALHAARWLTQLGCTVVGAPSIDAARAIIPVPVAILIAGDDQSSAGDDKPSGATGAGVTEIWLWDYEVGQAGVGAFASAVSGVSTVIGPADGAPGVMPAGIPEKWAGMFGASLALALKLAGHGDDAGMPHRVDVSAADLLRAFAEQNSGNHAGVPYGWRRNGRTAIEHGGVFPQGFFRCKDGFMAVQARSRADWRAIITALDDPHWGAEPDFQNPFTLSEDDARILPLLDAELMQRDRHTLLERAVATGAPIAPVLSLDEAQGWDIFRPGFIAGDGRPALPLVVRRAA